MDCLHCLILIENRTASFGLFALLNTYWWGSGGGRGQGVGGGGGQRVGGGGGQGVGGGGVKGVVGGRGGGGQGWWG